MALFQASVNHAEIPENIRAVGELATDPYYDKIQNVGLTAAASERKVQ